MPAPKSVSVVLFLAIVACAFLPSARAGQPGYRASLYDTAWPADMANLNRTNAVINAGLPRGFSCQDVRVDTVPMPFPVFSYTRKLDEVFVLGGLPRILQDYVSRIDGHPAGSTGRKPHITKYSPRTGKTTQLLLDRGKGFAYIGGALVHANGYVYVVSQAYIYKIDPETMTIVAGRDLPRAPFPGRLTSIYNGLSASKSGNLLTKFFAGIGSASRFFMIDKDTLEIVSSIDYPGASPRLTVGLLPTGEEVLYHLNRSSTFRFKIGNNRLALDKRWISRFDPYRTGRDKNDEPTSPVLVGGRVYYTTNTKFNAANPMRIFWQKAEAAYTRSDPPIAGLELIPGSGKPGWSFFHLAIDESTGTIIAADQGAKAIVAVRINQAGSLDYLWRKAMAVSARPAIVSDRGYVYATDYVEGRNNLVVLDLSTGAEVCRVPTPATRATVSTIIASEANEVYFGSNEPGRKTGLFHRFYIPRENASDR